MQNNPNTSYVMFFTKLIKISLFSTVLFLIGCASGPIFETENSKNEIEQEATQQSLLPSTIWPQTALDAFNNAVSNLGNDNESARFSFSEAIQISPTMEAAYFNLSKLELNDNNLDAVDNVASLAQKNSVESARLLSLWGTSKRKRGEFSEAKNYYLQAIELNPSYAAAILNLAILHDVYLGELSQAESYYLKYQFELSEQGRDDKRLKNWLTDLQRRLKQAGGG